MRLLSILTATLAFLTGVVSLSIASRIHEVYMARGVIPPNLAGVYFGSFGLVPGALFFLIGLTIFILLAIKRLKPAATISGISIVVMIAVITLMGHSVLEPISEVVVR